MKDYIFAVTDLTAFRDSLLNIGSDLVNIDESGSATIKSATTMIKYNGNQSVAIARINPATLVELGSFASMVLVGEAKNMCINSNDDVNWTDEALYHTIHSIDPVTYTDDDGTEHVYTPPKLHCVLA